MCIFDKSYRKLLLNKKVSGYIIIILNQDVDAKNLFDTFVVFEVKIFMNIYIFWYNYWSFR